MKVLLYDFRWINEHGCEIQGSVGGRFGRKKISIGDEMSLEACSAIRCAGCIENGVWKPCPKHSEGKAKCEYCRAIEGNFIFTAFDGFDQSQLQPGDLDKISGEHVVYFALFESGVLKVGVSKKERKVLRQIEQGSHQTLFWAEAPDGLVARQIETLARRAGIADKIQSRQKKTSLQPEISEEVARKELREALAKSLEGLNESAHLKKFISLNPEFVSWDSVYHTDVLPRIGKPLQPISLSEAESVSGVIRAIKGAFVIIETDHELVSLNMKSLSGRECDLSPKPMGLTLHTALQNSLF
jgi:predicted DNA-binding antitoxin AbrB/MazE fold protein